MRFEDWFKIEKKKNYGLIVKSKIIILKKQQLKELKQTGHKKNG